MHNRNNATRYPPTATNSCIGRQCGSGRSGDCVKEGSFGGHVGSIGVEPEANRYKERDALNDKDATVSNGIVLWRRRDGKRRSS